MSSIASIRIRLLVLSVVFIATIPSASAQSGWSIGFDFRDTTGFVTDPPGDTAVLPTTSYPTNYNGTNFGWTNINLVQGRNRSASVDPRLAGINFATNGAPATFYVDLPAAGTYDISLAMGDESYPQCWDQCEIQFFDGNTLLATITKGETNQGFFYDARGNNWSAMQWPGSNMIQQVTLAGTRLTMVVGTSHIEGAVTIIAFLGIAQSSFTLSANPAALTIQQGNQGTSTITSTISGGFNSSIALSATGAPSGTTVSFSPNPLPAPGGGNSTMTIMVGANTTPGSYPITVTGSGGGIQQNTTVTLTVTAPASFSLSASPSSLTLQQGHQGTSTITSTIVDGFNSAISLSATGTPTGASVSFNPNPIPAPGSGSSTMSITVGASTPLGTYPITVTGNGGGVQQNTTVTLTVTSATFGIGFDFRNSQNYVTDPPGDTYVLATTAYPTDYNGTNYGWTNLNLVQARDRSTSVDPRLAGINFATNGSPATFYVDLPSAGTYNLSLALGDDGYMECWEQCQIQFYDGSTLLAGLTVGLTNQGFFYDALGNNWSAAQWPSHNLTQQVTLAGTRLTTVVGTTHATGDVTPIAFLGIGGVVLNPNFSLSASPSSVTIQQGNQGASTITSTISGGFNSAITLSATGMPSGTTVSFNPNPLPAPGSGNSTMTITVGASTPTGTYPITVTGNGGGVQQTTTVTLTVTSQSPPTFTLSALPSSLTIQQGNQNTSTITSTIANGFNSAITLSASGMPTGTTVSFNPNPIPAPGSGNSTMTITVGASTAPGTYPITVTGNGGGVQQNTTVTLTVTLAASFTLSASPGSVTIAQGSQGGSTITSTISGGFNAAITLSATGAPPGTTVAFNPNPIPAPGSGSSTMTIMVGASTPPGTYPITVTGNGGGVQQNTTVTLTVTLAASFTLSASPGSVTIAQGSQGGSTITSIISGGFNAAITLSATGAPSGTTVSFNPNPIPAPGSGSSAMTIMVGASTPIGTYPITVTGNGGGVQQNTTVTLNVTSSTWRIGFDFRNTQNYVTDPAGDTYVLASTAYPTNFNGTNFGWQNVALVQARDRSTTVDPRLAGINYAFNGTPATFSVDLPASGTYNLSLAMGDAGYQQCSIQCEIQFFDGNTLVATVNGGLTRLGYFYDAQGHNWSAAQWPTMNLSAEVAISGSRLTMIVGTNNDSGDLTPIAFLGISEVSITPNFLVSAMPTRMSVVQGNQGTSTITTTIAGGFDSSISLSASGSPSGTTVSFNPNPIAAPGAGSSTMTVSVGSGTPVGNYPITVSANGGGVQQTVAVTLTVTAAPQPNYILTVSPPALAVAQGRAGNTTATTTLLGGFNSSISLSASGMPAGTTVSFNPQTIPAPGGGSSMITVMVSASTPLGTYPITITGNGGGVQQTATLQLTVLSSVWQQGFDFRGTTNFVTDPPGDTPVIQTTSYPTTGDLTTYGWSYTANISALNRSSQVDPRLAGINYITNGIPVPFYVDLPAPGTYNLSLAMGDDAYQQCFNQCLIQFWDGDNLLASVSGGETNQGYFYDAQGNNWSAAQWPTNNVSRQVTLAGTQLTMTIGTILHDGYITPVAYLGVTQVSTGPTFVVQAPSSLNVGQGEYSTADVFTVLVGSFNSPISLSASGAPQGVTVTFNPSTIPAPGAGTSIMTITVPSGTPTGSYPLIVTGQGGGVMQPTTLMLNVTVTDPPALSLNTTPAVSAPGTGGQVMSTLFTTVSNGFNSAVTLSASGVPNGGTVSFNPSTIAAPGSGSSTMTIAVPSGTRYGSYPITVMGSSPQGKQTTMVTLTVSASGQVNLPSGTGWVPLNNDTSFCNESPGYTYYNPQVGEVDAFDFLGSCEGGYLVYWGGGAADTANDRYFLWTSGHNLYQGNEMYELQMQGPTGPTLSRITDPGWSVDNTDVPPDCVCKGTLNCGQGMWHDGAGNLVSNPFSESANSGPLFESIPAPDGSFGQPSCGYGSRFEPNAREIYAGMVYNTPLNKLFAWGGAAAADPTGLMYSNWTLNLNQNPPQWTRLQNNPYGWYTAAVYDYTTGHQTSGYDLVFDENRSLYQYSPANDTYTTLANSLPYIGYNADMELDPLHHYLVMENGDAFGGYHLRILNIDSCNGTSCKTTSLDQTASCAGALGYWAGISWDSRRNVMAIFPSSTNCSGAGCTAPFNTAYLLNPDPNNPVTITYQGQQQTIPPQQCFAASYGPVPTESLGPGVYTRFKYYPNEDVYLYIPTPYSLWILRLE
ncbi:MAG: hypothetical protein WB555_17195 [Candidatus Korobacteraceae bacterium]